jgi:hypothetical protein
MVSRVSRIGSLGSCLVAAAGLLAGSAGMAQIEQQDIDEASPVPVEVEQLFADAEAKFATVDQTETVAMFGQVVAEVEPLAQAGHPTAASLLLRSLSYRAQAEFNFGNSAPAETDIRRILEFDPSFEIDRQSVSRRFAELFDKVRAQTVGRVDPAISPSDAEVAIAGRSLGSPQGPFHLQAGEYMVAVTRPGYVPQSVPMTIAAGSSVALEVTLERSSAVLTLRTRPNEASVFVDGAIRGETRGQAGADFVPSGEVARYAAQEFSERLLIEEVAVGRHELEVRKPGFRPWRQSVEVAELADYDLGAAVLEREAGTILLDQLPTDAELSVDGRVVRPSRDPSGAARLVLSPGSYRLSVTRGTAERFERIVDLADQGEVSLEVQLRPSVILLGVLGGDRTAAEQLRRGLTDALEPLGDWSLLDRGTEAAPVLERLGLQAARLRTLSPNFATADARPEPIDWAAVQGTTARELPGALYVLGVLSDDLMARAAELWIWPAPPGPSQPERRLIDLGDLQSLHALANGFRPTFLRPRPVLGVVVMDSLAAGSPVVAHLAPAGPAKAAGLAEGDVILALAGSPVFGARQLEEQLLKLEPGESATLEVRRGGETQEIRCEVGRSWELVQLDDPTAVYPALSAAVEAELARASDFPRWMLQLNRAALQFIANDPEGAVRSLREIDAASVPDAGGVGRATLEYLLGLALVNAGPRYADLAREAFERAAVDPEARLHHADGPLVRPRARVRIEQLAAAQP